MASDWGIEGMTLNGQAQGSIWANMVERAKAQEVLDGDADVTGQIFSL